MHLHYLVGVAIVISFGVISEVFSTVSTTKVSAHNTNVSFPRILRTRSLDGNSEEERTGGGATTVSTSEKIATLFKSSKVKDEQLQKWLSKGKSADDVFYRMKLAKTHTSIFNDPQFSKWVQYADDLSATASGKGTSAISTLTTQYGDDQLYKILGAAKRDSSSEELASKLQSDQLKRWIAIGKDPDEIYKIYDLQLVGDKLLREPQFSAWTKYVDDVNAKHGGAISIIPTLRLVLNRPHRTASHRTLLYHATASVENELCDAVKPAA
ncbi:hypothetical protein DVH05_012433 [Phytophthora capsici]|nr:hypothetical protein DVH05_012433 [Phytophthora capsici]